MTRKAKTMHIREDDLEEVQGMIGWDDLVNTLSAVVKIPISQGHEVWVDEKRNRMEEHTPKHHEKREVNQK